MERRGTASDYWEDKDFAVWGLTAPSTSGAPHASPIPKLAIQFHPDKGISSSPPANHYPFMPPFISSFSSKWKWQKAQQLIIVAPLLLLILLLLSYIFILHFCIQILASWHTESFNQTSPFRLGMRKGSDLNTWRMLLAGFWVCRATLSASEHQCRPGDAGAEPHIWFYGYGWVCINVK